MLLVGSWGSAATRSLSSPAGVPRASSMLPFFRRILGAAGSRALCRMLELLGGRGGRGPGLAVTLKAGHAVGSALRGQQVA